MKKSKVLAIFGGSLLFLSGCVIYDEPVPQITRTTTKPAPVTFSTVAVFNFRLQETLKGEGPQLSKAVAGALINEKIAQEVIRSDYFPTGAKDAAAKAEAEGAAAAVYGTIDELIYGGITTESRATVTLLVVDASTAKLLWELTGTLSEPPHKPQDNIFQVDTGKPAPMPLKLANRLVERMVQELRVNPPQEPRATKDFTSTNPPKSGTPWQNR